MNTVKINPTSSVGYLVGIGAWSISFLTLIWGYMAYRLRAGQWLADYLGEGTGSRALVNTGLLILSAGILHQFFHRRKAILFWLGIALGISFLQGQWDLWRILLERGLTLNSSIAGSFLYLLTGFHAVHIAVGLLILLPFGIKLSRLTAGERYVQRFQFALKFWDLLLFFWLVLLFLIFVFK